MNAHDQTGPAADRPTAVNLAQKYALFAEHWSPKVVAQANGWEIKLVKASGSFVWHDHDIDEVFLVVSGRLVIQRRDHADVHLQAGELYVVPRGVEHRPHAEQECELMLLEPAGVGNTGQSAGALTATDEWI